MISLPNMSPHSSPLIVITILYFIIVSFTTFDMRLIQAKRAGELLPDEPILPDWTGIFIWIQWGLGIALLIINWKYALSIFLIAFVLKVLPVLEFFGNILAAPLRPRKKSEKESSRD